MSSELRLKSPPCSYCDCKEFVANPWKEEKCINCYHPHSSSATAAPAKKQLFPKTTIRNLQASVANTSSPNLRSPPLSPQISPRSPSPTPSTKLEPKRLDIHR